MPQGNFGDPRPTQYNSEPNRSYPYKNWKKSLLDVHNKRGSDAGSIYHLILGISNITWDKIERRRLLKAQICGSWNLSERQKMLLAI
jgi:hypothetical protein